MSKTPNFTCDKVFISLALEKKRMPSVMLILGFCVCLFHFSNGQQYSSRELPSYLGTIPSNFIDAFKILNQNLRYAETFQTDKFVSYDFSLKGLKDEILEKYQAPELLSEQCNNSTIEFFRAISQRKEWALRGI